MKLYKDKFSIIFTLLSTFILIYVIYRSEVIWSGSQREYYLIYYLFSLSIFLLSLFSFFIYKKIKIYISILLISFISAIYLFEFYLNMSENLIINKKEKIYYKKTNKEYDKRSRVQIYKDLNRDNQNVTSVVSPNYYLYYSKPKLFPLSGISNSLTINCNENGYYSLFKSDRYGFNNPNEEWDKDKIDYLIIGDSFAKGSCVNRPNDIASLLRSNYGRNSISLGYNSKGPLMELATLKEYLSSNVKKIIWLYFEGNDIYNLENELQNEFLNKYLQDIKFHQNLKNRQSEIDKVSNELLEKILAKKEKEYKLINSINYKTKNFIKFYKTRKMIFSFFGDKKLSTAEYKLTSDTEKKFSKIINFAVRISNENESNFYFVYLPSYERFNNRLDNFNFDKIKKIIEALDVEFIDVNKEIFNKYSNPLILFPFEMNGHYNEEGYKELAKLIYEITK